MYPSYILAAAAFMDFFLPKAVNVSLLHLAKLLNVPYTDLASRESAFLCKAAVSVKYNALMVMKSHNEGHRKEENSV